MTDHPGLSEQRAQDAAFLSDLAGRLFRMATPAMGFDQGDTDQLYRIARAFAQPPASGADRTSKSVPVEGYDEQDQRETAADLVSRLAEMLGDDTDFDNYSFSIKRGNLRRLLKALTNSGAPVPVSREAIISAIKQLRAERRAWPLPEADIADAIVKALAANPVPGDAGGAEGEAIIRNLLAAIPVADRTGALAEAAAQAGGYLRDRAHAAPAPSDEGNRDEH